MPTIPRSCSGELPLLWITERAEGRAAELQLQLRTQQQHLGLPPLDYLIAAVAEDHGAGLLHYDQDFDRLAAHTDVRAKLTAPDALPFVALRPGVVGMALSEPGRFDGGAGRTEPGRSRMHMQYLMQL